MKMSFSLLFIGAFVHFSLAYSPIVDGALANVGIMVVDDIGEPVSNASVSVTFYTTSETVDVRRGKTDENGYFSANGRCIGEVYALIRKDGHYETKIAPAFRTLSDSDAARRHRWSDDVVKTTARLKRKRNAVDMKFFRRQYWPFPVTNQVFLLDLEKGQWCPPYGNGRHGDISLLYEAVEHPEEGWAVSYWNRLTLAMPNAVDGFYRLKNESFSKFAYAYEADTNAVYSKSIILEIERKNDRMVKVEIPRDDEYFIFRVRTETNELGRVTRANYGRIGEKLHLAMGLSIKAWFNPAPNDTNLEPK